MKNWNKTGKIKAIILGLLAFPNLFIPIGATSELGLAVILMPLIFGSIAIPLITRFNAAPGREIIKPIWNDNPLTLRRPLSFFHFCSFFFLTVGLSMVIGTGIKFHALSFFGLTAISFAQGMLTGIWLTLKWAKSK